MKVFSCCPQLAHCPPVLAIDQERGHSSEMAASQVMMSNISKRKPLSGTLQLQDFKASHYVMVQHLRHRGRSHDRDRNPWPGNSRHVTCLSKLLARGQPIFIDVGHSLLPLPKCLTRMSSCRYDDTATTWCSCKECGTNASSSDGTVMLMAFSKHKACPNSESQSAAATPLRLPRGLCQNLVLGAAMGPFSPLSMCG